MNCKKKDKEKGKDIGKFSKKSGEKTGSLLFQIQRKREGNVRNSSTKLTKKAVADADA